MKFFKTEDGVLINMDYVKKIKVDDYGDNKFRVVFHLTDREQIPVNKRSGALPEMQNLLDYVARILDANNC